MAAGMKHAAKVSAALIIAGGLFVCTTTPARADWEPHPQAMDWDATFQPETRTETYRGSIAIADAAALGMFIGGGLGESDVVGTAGILTYVLGSPAVHVAHGNGVGAMASLGLRVALPVGGFAVGLAVGEQRCKSDPSPGWFCGLGEAVLGGAIGVVSASAIDIALLARTDVPVEKQDPWMLHAGNVNANPVVASTPEGGLSLGLLGTF